jgi:hypothetical protein
VNVVRVQSQDGQMGKIKDLTKDVQVRWGQSVVFEASSL